MFKIIRFALLLCVTRTLAAQSGTSHTVNIPIRAFGALTGPVKSFGINSRAALAAANDRINREGGIQLANGSIGRFQITYDDDHCKPDDGIALLRKAAESTALAVIGPSCSSVAEPLYAQLQHHVGDISDSGMQVPVFTDGATKANLARISEWAFRNSPNETDMYTALWKWVHTTQPTLHTVYVGEESDFAHSHSTLQNIIKKGAEDAGFIVEGGTKWSINDTAFDIPAAQIKAAHADIVVISAHALTTCGVLKQLFREHYKPKLLVGLTSASTPETLTLCGAEADGLLIPTSFIADSDETRREAREVEAHGGIADLHSMSAWEILYTLKRALESGGIIPGEGTTTLNRARLRTALSQLSTMQGTMGTISRTEDRESLKPFVLVQVRAGQWQVVSDTGLAPRITTVSEETFRIPFGQTGLKLFLRHLPATTPAKDQIAPALFVHGATFPSALAAAFPFGGSSWMQNLSSQGIDSWALDFMGYGGSDRYTSMSSNRAGGDALLHTVEAAEQIRTAVQFIEAQRQITKVSIIAHSWGTMAGGLFATRYPALLDHLVLFGPVTRRVGETAGSSVWRPALDVTVAAQMERFSGYLPKDERPVLDDSDMKLWGEQYLASDPTSRTRNPPSVRVPSGPAADSELAWEGTFPYRPEQIRCPVLIVRGEWDVVTRDEDAAWIFNKLVNSPIRRDVKISRGTHVMHLEESRRQLYQETQIFLESQYK